MYFNNIHSPLLPYSLPWDLTTYLSPNFELSFYECLQTARNCPSFSEAYIFMNGKRPKITFSLALPTQCLNATRMSKLKFLTGCQWDSSLEMRLDSPSVLLWPYCTLASFLLFSWTATTKLLSYCNISSTKFGERVHTTYSSYIMKNSATQQKSRGCVFMTPAV